MEDFIRWYSPRDWSLTPQEEEEEGKVKKEEESTVHSSDGWDIEDEIEMKREDRGDEKKVMTWFVF